MALANYIFIIPSATGGRLSNDQNDELLMKACNGVPTESKSQFFS